MELLKRALVIALTALIATLGLIWFLRWLGSVRALHFEHELHQGMSRASAISLAAHNGGKFEKNEPMLHLDKNASMSEEQQIAFYAQTQKNTVTILTYRRSTGSEVSAYQQIPGIIIEYMSLEGYQTFFKQNGVGYLLQFSPNGKLQSWRKGHWSGGIICICM